MKTMATDNQTSGTVQAEELVRIRFRQNPDCKCHYEECTKPDAIDDRLEHGKQGKRERQCTQDKNAPNQLTESGLANSYLLTVIYYQLER